MGDDETIVGDRYVLGEVLGRGGMARVYHAIDRRLGRSVAVKHLNAALAADPLAQTRFRREAQAAASLNHPAIAAVFDTGSDVDPVTGTDIPFLVMELVEGQTLRDVLRGGPSLTAERSLEIVSQVLAALSHSHAAGLVHRDIKPGNVMLTPDGAVKVMDFGIARAADASTTSLTQTAAVIGTAAYLSPEQARGEQVDTRSDLYSTGCLLYELLLGRPLFVGDSSLSLAYQHVNADPVPPRAIDPTLSADVDNIVLRALAKDPDRRYPSAADMKADVDRVLERGLVHGHQPAAVADPVPPAPDDDPTAVSPRAPVAPATRVVVDDTVNPPPDGPDGVEPDEPRRRRVGLVLLGVVGALALLGVLLFALPRLLGSDSSQTAQVRVPAVLGRSQSDADAALRNVNLVPRFTNVTGPGDDTEGTVTGQTPSGGASVAAGSEVAVEVNTGPKSAPVPDGLVGQDVKAAEKALKKAGFDKVSTQRAATQSADARADQVLAVKPGEGTVTPLKDKVVLVVARDLSGPVTTRPTSKPQPTTPATTARTTQPAKPSSSAPSPSGSSSSSSTSPSPSGGASSPEPSASTSTSPGQPSASPTKQAKPAKNADVAVTAKKAAAAKKATPAKKVSAPGRRPAPVTAGQGVGTAG